MVWFACAVETGAELKVRKRGRKLGYEMYCPTFETLTKPRGKRQPCRTDVAAYPGYVFVQETEDTTALEAEDGVYGLVSFGGVVARIGDEAMEVVRLAEREGVFGRKSETDLPAELELDQLVKIANGPMQSMCGVVKHKQGNRIMLEDGDMLQGPVWVRRDMLVAA